MRKKFVFATNNSHKLEEVTAILGEKVELLSMKDIKCDTDIPETADTLEGNALLKARYIFDNYHLDCFADDTGLEVEALGGAPGVYSARYAGDAHNSEANMKKLLKDMEGIENRKAQFRTVFVLIIDGKEHLFEGIVKGEITKNRKGTSGFGYDPIFIPEGYTQTFAEMGNELKNKISHRALATNKLCKFLMQHQYVLSVGTIGTVGVVAAAPHLVAVALQPVACLGAHLRFLQHLRFHAGGQ